MKFVLVFLAAVLAVSQAGDITYNCPQTYLDQLKPSVLKNYLGVWYTLRATARDDFEEAACFTQTHWTTKDTPATRVESVTAKQVNGTWEYLQVFASIKPAAVEGEVESFWQWHITDKITVDATFIDSDNGQLWAIGHSCSLNRKGDMISNWAILSRCKTMDPKLEQTLVERVQKYSGLTPDKLRGIRQTGCYDLDHKDFV